MGPRLRDHASALGLGLVTDEHNDLREPLGFLFFVGMCIKMEVRDSRNLVHDFLTSLSPFKTPMFVSFRRLSLGGSPSSSRLDVGTSYRLVKKRKYRQQL